MNVYDAATRCDEGLDLLLERPPIQLALKVVTQRQMPESPERKEPRVCDLDAMIHLDPRDLT